MLLFQGSLSPVDSEPAHDISRLFLTSFPLGIPDTAGFQGSCCSCDFLHQWIWIRAGLSNGPIHSPCLHLSLPLESEAPPNLLPSATLINSCLPPLQDLVESNLDSAPSSAQISPSLVLVYNPTFNLVDSSHLQANLNYIFLSYDFIRHKYAF